MEGRKEGRSFRWASSQQVCVGYRPTGRYVHYGVTQQDECEDSDAFMSMELSMQYVYFRPSWYDTYCGRKRDMCETGAVS